MPYALGRIVHHDPRSKMFLYEPVDKPVRNVVWQRFSPIIDQGDLGCCTGAAMAGWLGCSPTVGAIVGVWVVRLSCRWMYGLRCANSKQM